MTRSWIRRFFARTSPVRRHKSPQARFCLELLEDRNAPAAFAEVGASLKLDLNVASEAVTIVSKGSSYEFTLSGTVWSGTDSANVTGDSKAKLTVTTAGLAAFTAGINITDSAAGTSVTFEDSAGKSYTNLLSLTLDAGS